MVSLWLEVLELRGERWLGALASDGDAAMSLLWVRWFQGG